MRLLVFTKCFGRRRWITSCLLQYRRSLKIIYSKLIYTNTETNFNTMWYEILPSFGIIFTAMSAPTVGMYYIHKLVLGNSYRRNVTEDFERKMYRRDIRITGDPYVVRGLECIPDE